jgi:hypothetical protein
MYKYSYRAWVAQACNPSYSGGKIRRIAIGSQARQIVPQDPTSKKPITKIGVAQGGALSSNPSTEKKNKGCKMV